VGAQGFVTGGPYAPIASPAFTGVPTAPTPAAADSSTKIATTAFVQGLVGGGPFLPLTGGTLTGSLTISANATIGNNLVVNNGATIAGTIQLNGPVDVDGGTFNIDPATVATWATAPAGPNQLANKAYVDGAVSGGLAGYLPLTGGTLSGTLAFAGMGTGPPDNLGTGERIKLFPGSTGNPDFSIGINTNEFWLTIPTTAPRWTFYAGAGNPVAVLWGTGQLYIGAGGSGVSRGPAGSINTDAGYFIGGTSIFASPALTGTPTAPTPTAGDNSTRLATTAFVQTAAGAYLPLAGGTLTGALTINTGGLTVGGGGASITGAVTTSGNVTVGNNLNVTNAATVSGNLVLPSGASLTAQSGSSLTFNGPVTVGASAGTFAISSSVVPTWPGTPAGGNQLVNKSYCDANAAACLSLTGGTLTGGLTISAGGITETGPAVFNGSATFNANLSIVSTGTPTWTGTPVGGNQLTNKTYVDGAVATALPLTGGTLTGVVTINLNAAPIQSVITGALLRMAQVDAQFARAHLDSYGSAVYSQLSLRNARGTGAAMTATQSGDEVGRIGFTGCASAGSFQTAGGNFHFLRMLATENWGTSAGGKFEVWTIANGSSSGALRATFDPNFTITGAGYQPGGGSWTATSDTRLKRDVAPYNAGLAEVCRLNPIVYRYNGLGGILDTETFYRGLAAEDVQSVMPEMVHSLPMKLREEDPEPVDVLHLNATALTFALVNAVKELTARLEALEGLRR
jgi:hypothetical protein